VADAGAVVVSPLGVVLLVIAVIVAVALWNGSSNDSR
jgi:hypothetical protein